MPRMARAVSYPAQADYVDLPMGTGFAAALDKHLASGGARRNNPKAGPGMKYRSGAVRGMTMDQAVQDAKEKWASASPAVRAKYEAMGASLGSPMAVAPPVLMDPASNYVPGMGREIAPGVFQQVHMPQHEPVNPSATAGAGRGTPVQRPTATTAPTGGYKPASAQAVQGYIDANKPVAVSPPAPVPVPSKAAVPQAVAPPADGGNLAQRIIGNVAGNILPPAVTGAVVQAAGQPMQKTIAGTPTNDLIFVGETPPGPGYTLIGNVNGQKKWSKGADTTAANASAAAQSAAAVAALPKPQAVAPPAPRYKQGPLGTGVLPVDPGRPDPAFAAYQKDRADFRDKLPVGSPEAKAAWGRVKAFEDAAMKANAREEERRRLNPLMR